MKNPTLLLIISFLILNSSCANKEIEKPLIKSDDFLDYSDFIHRNPQSQNFEKALKRYLHLRDSVGHFGMCMKNNLDIEPISLDTIIIYENYYTIDSVKNICLDYLKTEGIWQFYNSWKKEVINPFNNEKITLTRGRFDINIHFDNSPYTTTQNVTKQIIKAIDIYKNELAHDCFKKDFKKLSNRKAHFLDSLLGNRIDFYNLPPLPTPNEADSLKVIEIIDED